MGISNRFGVPFLFFGDVIFCNFSFQDCPLILDGINVKGILYPIYGLVPFYRYLFGGAMYPLTELPDTDSDNFLLVSSKLSCLKSDKNTSMLFFIRLILYTNLASVLVIFGPVTTFSRIEFVFQSYGNNEAT